MTRTMLLVLLLPFVLAGPVLAESYENASTSPIGDPVAPGNAPVWIAPMGTVLYDNGPIFNSPGTGVGGNDESILQTLTLSMNTFGWGFQHGSIDNRIADDFEVPAGQTWDVSQITFFGYQSFAGPISTITGVYFAIYDAAPPGGNLVFGNIGPAATNRMIATSWTGVYRVTETSSGTNTDRHIMANVCSPMGTLQLPSGTYWIAWQTAGSATSGPWANPVAILGQCVVGNALQSVDDGVTYNPALDSGLSQCQTAFPFIIEGSTGPIGVEPTSFAKIKGLYR